MRALLEELVADQKNAAEEPTLTSAAKSIGAVLGKVAHAVGVAGDAPVAPPPPPPAAPPAPPAAAAPVVIPEPFRPKKRALQPDPERAPQPADVYKSDYIGSGTFIIKKPKRNKTKLHQSRAKSPQRGARK